MSWRDVKLPTYQIPMVKEAILEIGRIPLAGNERQMYMAFNETICAKLSAIGIECRRETGAVGFLPGIRITNGVIFLDVEVALPATLLHEAAHISLTTPSRRTEAGADLDAVYARMRIDARRVGWGRHDPRYLAILASGEDRAAYALAWAWGKAWGIPPDVAVYPHGSYNLSTDELRQQLEEGSFAGVRFLEQAQIVEPGSFPRLVRMTQTLDPNAMRRCAKWPWQAST